jgi:ribonucleoside-diphosphate reductase alpha chain
MQTISQAAAPVLSENSLRVLQERYLCRDEGGNISETPAELFQRVALAVAKAELVWGTADDAVAWKKKFYRIMSELLFLPNSPTLMNAGMPGNQRPS